jgi:GT2 family glycosyltransferase
MNISFVLAVYNKLELTKQCYKRIRDVYPDEHLIISSGGSTDGTKEWLESLIDDNLTYFHEDERLSFSDTYNAGIALVDTEKLVLIHNDMVIGEGFLEALERLITEDTLLSYTTIEPPIFIGHERPGKVLLELGRTFEDFNYNDFNNYVQQWKNSDEIYDGAVFFMSGYKKMFEDIGGFDGFSFIPCFCEDDDFLIRAKLKGYKLKTCNSAITYHFVSQTSRFSEEMKENRNQIEINSNRNFIRKWGMSSSTFNDMNYQKTDGFNYEKTTMGITTNDSNILPLLEPFFDEIDFRGDFSSYINEEQKYTNYDLNKKFTPTGNVTATIKAINPLTNLDIANIMKIRASINPTIDDGDYQVDNLIIQIKKRV